MKNISQRVIDKRNEWAASDAKRDAGLKEPSNIEIAKNITYKICKDGAILKLDIYHPVRPKDLLPVVFSIHGGGYFYGDKELYRFYCMNFATMGYTVVNIDYRLAPEYPFPACIEDIFDALCWVGDNVRDYMGDPMRMMLIGDSAGAQLASQFGALYSNPYYANLYGFSFPTTFKITCLSLACGLYDLAHNNLIRTDKSIMDDYMGPDFDYEDERVKVFDYITNNYPPAYVFSSTDDFLKESCEPFSNLLTEKGIYSESKIYESYTNEPLLHVFHCNMYLEEAKKCNRDQISFFEKILGL